MGLILCGDFNKLPIKMLKNCHPEIKQIVKENTRGSAILDLIITNLHSHYRKPTILAPLGSSDHNCVMLSPNVEQQTKPEIRRTLRRSNGVERRQALTVCLASTDWTPVYEAEDVDEKVQLFNTTLQTALEVCMPLKRQKTCSLDKPWMTDQIKSAIRKRQKAYNKWGKVSKWRKIRN